jgi:hypothetical protein
MYMPFAVLAGVCFGELLKNIKENGSRGKRVVLEILLGLFSSLTVFLIALATMQ